VHRGMMEPHPFLRAQPSVVRVLAGRFGAHGFIYAPKSHRSCRVCQIMNEAANYPASYVSTKEAEAGVKRGLTTIPLARQLVLRNMGRRLSTNICIYAILVANSLESL
jgi:hypothetical protein